MGITEGGPLRLPVMQKQCATCPFRDTGWTELRGFLIQRAMTEASPICHSTGKALSKRVSKKSLLCRGARNFMLDYLCGTGFLSAATDAAWDAKCKEMGIP